MSQVSTLASIRHIQRPWTARIPWAYEIQFKDNVALQLTPFDMIVIDKELRFTFKVDGWREGEPHNYQEDQITDIAIYEED